MLLQIKYAYNKMEKQTLFLLIDEIQRIIIEHKIGPYVTHGTNGTMGGTG